MAACLGMCREEFRLKKFLLDHDNSGTFVRFQCGWFRPYIAWRIFWGLYHLAWIIVTGVKSDEWAGPDRAQQVKWFIYLTDWAYLTLTIATLVDAAVVVFVRVKRRDIAKGISSTMTWYLKANWVIFNLANDVSITMSLAFWALVYHPNYENAFGAVNIATHIINAIYIIINISVTGMPIQILHFWFSIIYGFVYSFFSLFYYLAGGTNHDGNPYIYSVIDWRSPGMTALYCIIITFVAMPIVHLICFGIHFLKVYISGFRCFRCCRTNQGSEPWDEATEMERGATVSCTSSEPKLYG